MWTNCYIERTVSTVLQCTANRMTSFPSRMSENVVEQRGDMSRRRHSSARMYMYLRAQRRITELTDRKPLRSITTAGKRRHGNETEWHKQ